MSDDIELLRTYVQTRSNTAFTELVNRTLGLVYASALRRLGGDHHLAADVAQQVFTALARNAHHVAERASLEGWLYTTTRNIAVDTVRAERRRHQREQQAMQDSTGSEPPVDWEKLRPVLDDALDQLNDREREAILQRFFMARRFGEIGAALRLSEDGARMRVDRALEKLRRVLARRGISSTGAALGIALAQQATAGVPAGLGPTIAQAAAAVTAAPTATSSLLAMITTQKTVGAACLVALLGLGTAWHETQLARAAETAQAAERAQLARELRTLSAATAKRATLERAVAAAASPTPATPASPLPDAHASVRPSSRTARAATGTAAPADATFAAAWASERSKASLLFMAEWRTRLARALPLLAAFDLTSEQRAALLALGEVTFEPERFAEWGQPGRDLPYYQSAMNHEWDAACEAILGAPAFAEFKRLRKADDQVRTLANYVARLEIPLASDQPPRLLQALSRPEIQTATPEQVDAVLAAVLTPAQLAAWKRQRELAAFERELVQEYQQTIAASAGTPTS